VNANEIAKEQNSTATREGEVMKKLLIPMVLAAAILGQAPAAKSQKQPGSAKPSIDTVIELVQGGMSESLVIKTLQRQGKAYSLSTEDMVKLQKAGVTENVISVMMDPKAPLSPPTAKATPAPDPPAAPETALATGPSPNGGASATAPASPAGVAGATPYPPDLKDLPNTIRKRRVIVEPFNYAAIQTWIQAEYHTNQDVGPAIRAMLISRLQKSNLITVLERSNLEEEQTKALTADVAKGTGPHKGRILGADCILTGDLTLAGRDDKDKHTGGIGGGILSRRGIGGGGLDLHHKDNKAVVNLELRVADAETSEVLLTESAKGESSRKDKSIGLGGLAIGGAGAAGGGGSNSTSSSNFADTIMGEAIQNAVDNIAQKVEQEIAQIPPKARTIEGRVASITANGVYLALGGDDGLLLGDRFEILEIKNEVLDPQTKEPIDVEAVKVGEVVVREVHDHAAIGTYGGQPLAVVQLTGKGYQARLVSK
jgi:curli biogenesis system outer membrane secretion channel CsgG